MADVQAVIFDLDDTLYPERVYVSSGFAAVAAAFQDKLGNSQLACREMEDLFDASDIAITMQDSNCVLCQQRRGEPKPVRIGGIARIGVL